MRLTLSVFTLVLVFASDAAAARRPVARLSERPDYAIAGDAAVILQASRRAVSVDPDGRRRVQTHSSIVDPPPKGIRSS